MKVLLVAFEFPPLGGGGVQRSMKFAKYLPENGITPIVVTTDLASFATVMENPLDENLQEELAEDLIIERVPCMPLRKAKNRLSEWRRIFLSLVEPQAKLWRPFLDKHLPKLVDAYNPQAIYVSLPPFSMGPLWCHYADKFNLPLVLDFRDAWSQWRIAPYGSWLHYWLTVRLENQCLQKARRVVCSSEQIRKDLLNLHRNVPPDKIVTITNGYDTDVSDWSLPISEKAKGERFIIGYVGNFYYSPAARASMMQPWWRKKPHRMLQYSPRLEDWLYRSPYFFFRTVELVLRRNPEVRDKLRIRFAGKKPDWLDQQVSYFGLQEVVEFTGYLTHKSVLKFQEQCDCLLVTSSKVIGGNDYSIAGKTFEYFSMRKPILGFVTEGAQKKILEQSGVSVLCDPDDPEQASEQLQNLIENRIGFSPNVEFLRGLHRQVLSRKLAEVLWALCKNSEQGENPKLRGMSVPTRA